MKRQETFVTVVVSFPILALSLAAGLGAGAATALLFALLYASSLRQPKRRC